MVFFLAKSVPTQFVLTHIQLIPWILRIDKIKQKGLIFVSFGMPIMFDKVITMCIEVTFDNFPKIQDFR